MAGSSFIGKALNWLNGFLSKMTSPLGGFNMQDVKVKQDGDIFSSVFSFTADPNSEIKFNIGDDEYSSDAENQLTDIKGNKVNMGVLLQATNAQKVFAPIFSSLNNLDKLEDDTFEGTQKNDLATTLDILLGADRTNNTYTPNNGKGLLGANLAEYGPTKWSAPKLDGKTWSWGYVADYLQWSLECKAAGKEYGAIDGQPLSKCGELIGEYLAEVGVIANAGEVKVDINRFAIPILMRMQAWLADYYVSACKKYLGDKADEFAEAEPMEKPEAPTEEPEAAAEEPATEEEPTSEESTTSEGSPVEESKRITVTLQKITATSEVKLLGLDSNCLPADTLGYVDDIINQDEFLDVLTEEPQTFNIDIDSDGYDIEQCECCEINPCKSLEEVFKAGIRAYRNLYIIHWMSNGNDMMKLHLLAEEMYEELAKEIDTTGELLVEKCDTVPQLDFPCDYVAVQNYDFQTGLDVIQSLINMYIDCIDCAYPNQTSDVQSTLDEWLRYWNKEMNYFVKRQEI